MRFVEACEAARVQEGKAVAAELEGVRVAIFRSTGRIHALSARCPHAGGAMAFGWVEEGEAVCPLHRWRFKLASGRCTTVRGESLRTFRCEEREDGTVWVEVDDPLEHVEP